LKVTVTGQAISQSGGQITKIHFDWGDGNAADAASLPMSHNYAYPGTYDITITAYDRNMLSTTKTMSLIIKEATHVISHLPPTNRLLVANASQDQIVNSGNTVTLDGSKNKNPDGNITSRINHIPSATNQSVITNQNTPVDVTLQGSDLNPTATLTAHIIKPSSNGNLSDINQDTGIVTYTPNQDFKGDDSFTFKVKDGKTDSNNTGIVSINVKK
jgi:hypothetical protein